MSAIRNSSVARGALSATGVNVLYTVPAGFVLLLKNVQIYNTTAAAANAQLIISTTNGSANAYLYTASVAASATVQWEGWVALNGTDRILLAIAAQPFQYWVSGALLPFSP